MLGVLKYNTKYVHICGIRSKWKWIPLRKHDFRQCRALTLDIQVPDGLLQTPNPYPCGIPIRYSTCVWISQPYVMVEHVIFKQWTLTCCCNSLQSELQSDTVSTGFSFDLCTSMMVSDPAASLWWQSSRKLPWYRSFHLRKRISIFSKIFKYSFERVVHQLSTALL